MVGNQTRYVGRIFLLSFIILLAAFLLCVFGVSSGALSQSYGIDLGPDYTQTVYAGEVVVYQHTITNTGITTDTFSLEAKSVHGWPVNLTDHSIELGAQKNRTFELSISIPYTTNVATEVTIITATSQTSPAIYASVMDTTLIKYRIRLPLIFKRWPPIPYSPVIYTIVGSDDGEFYIEWTESPEHLSQTYIVQEALDANFSSGLHEVCNTAQQYCGIYSKLAGIYFYRVRGYNMWGYGNWSNYQSATVLLPEQTAIYWINNEDGDGNYTVNWNPSARASYYILQEDNTSAFTNPLTVFSGNQLSWSATGKTAGTYYYRVRAVGGTGQSIWSTTQSVVVYPPAIPNLNPIDNSDGDGYYAISWGSAARASSYTLEEDTDLAFSSPTTLYSGSGQSWSVVNQSYGTYYYRVKAIGPTGQGGWSNIQSTNVPPPPPGVSVLPNHTTTLSGSGSYRYVFGEVYNNTSNYLEFVRISVNFFNNSQLVATDYTYTDLWYMHPYEKTCFLILVASPPTAWTHYTFEPPSYYTDGTARPNLTITSHSGSVSGSYYRILGQIRNDETVQVDYVSAVATLYNSIGKVIDCDYGYVNSQNLAPGQTSSFSITAIRSDPYAVTSYRLQTDGNK